MASIAIIGHGRSAEGQGWGRHIDACSLVVRMWDCHWQAPTDYGRKYDYGLFEIAGGITEKFNRFNQRDPRRGWIASFLWRAHTAIALPAKTEIIDQRRWTSVGVEIGGMGTRGKLQFTRGTIAACWAIENAKPDDKVILVGFDNVMARVALPIETGFSPGYRAEPSTFHFDGYVEGAARYGNHDFGVEYPVMKRLASRNGVEVVFAQREWKR